MSRNENIVCRAPARRPGNVAAKSIRMALIAAAMVLAGVSLPAHAQQVVGSGQTFVGQIAVPDGGTLTVEQGGTVTNAADDAVVDLINGSTITVRNDGTIAATGVGDDGINANGSTLILFNTGTISGADDAVDATNITSLITSGTLSAGDNGINLSGGATFTSILNTGRITAGNDGILAVSGTLFENRGTITAGGDGIDVSTLSTLVNSGTITADSDGVSSELTTLLNSGTISGASDGVFLLGPATLIENSGTISGGAFNGVVALGQIDRLINTGTIRTNGFNAIDIDFGSIVNAGSGLIEGPTGIEIDRGTAGNGSVTNAGRIRSRLGPSGTAIDFLGTGLDRLTVLGRSTIEGLINWDGLNDTFAAGPGRSSALTLTDLDSGAGAQPTVFAIDTGGLPFAVLRTAAGGAGTATTKIVVIDPSSFGLADSTLADITGGISGVLANQTNTARNVNGGGTAVASANGTSMTITPVAGHGPVLRAWAEVFGGWRGEESDGNRLASDHVFGGAVAGIETDTAGDGTRVGFFVGGSGSHVEVEFGSQDTDIGSVFGGVYAAHQAGDIAIDAAVTVGLADYDQQRFMNDNTVVGGVDTARADYNGFFVSPEITVSSSLAVADWMAVKPSLTLRYAGLFLDGYTEKDSKANLSVDDRDVHLISARAQVAMPVHMNTDAYGTLTTEIRVGADGRATVSEDNVRATLLGQNLNFTAGGDDEVLTGFAGAAFAYVMTTGTRLYGNIEAGYGTDEATHVTGRAGVKVPF